jgi:hypothetical protein
MYNSEACGPVDHCSRAELPRRASRLDYPNELRVLSEDREDVRGNGDMPPAAFQIATPRRPISSGRSCASGLDAAE